MVQKVETARDEATLRTSWFLICWYRNSYFFSPLLPVFSPKNGCESKNTQLKTQFTVVSLVWGSSRAVTLLLKPVFGKVQEKIGKIKNFHFRKFGIEKYETDLGFTEGPPTLEIRRKGEKNFGPCNRYTRWYHLWI